MDKTMALVISAMVLVISAIVVLFILNPSITDFSDNSDQLKKTGCEFQCKQAPEEASESCDCPNTGSSSGGAIDPPDCSTLGQTQCGTADHCKYEPENTGYLGQGGECVPK